MLPTSSITSLARPWLARFPWGCFMVSLQTSASISYTLSINQCIMPLVVEFWGLSPLILFFNMSTGLFVRFVLSTECYRARKLDYNDLNWPRCSAQVTGSLALTDGGVCQKQTLYISDYVKIVSL